MDELLKVANITNVATISSFNLREFMIAVVLSVVLSMIMAVVYRRTHSGLSYSRTFSTTMILMSLTITFIMLIIGSNLARAFSLVGALSIVRYRNALKESRDTAFIFITMAVGMACGTKLFGYAIIFTLFSSLVILLLEKTQFGTSNRDERLLQLTVPLKFEQMKELDKRLDVLTKGRYALLSSENFSIERVFVYSLELERKKIKSDIIDQIGEGFKDTRVKLITGFEKFNI